MASAIVVLPVRSMVTVSSAFISSRRARMMRRVSLAVGRWETAAGARRALARETGMSDRGLFSFRFRLRIAEAYSLKIDTRVQYFQPRSLPHDSPETSCQGGDY